MNTTDIPEVGTNFFLSSERVGASLLTGLDISGPFNETNGIKSTENLLEAFGRFQFEIDNASSSVTGNSNAIPDDSVSFNELAIDTDGTAKELLNINQVFKI